MARSILAVVEVNTTSTRIPSSMLQLLDHARLGGVVHRHDQQRPGPEELDHATPHGVLLADQPRQRGVELD